MSKYRSPSANMWTCSIKVEYTTKSTRSPKKVINTIKMGINIRFYFFLLIANSTCRKSIHCQPNCRHHRGLLSGNSFFVLCEILRNLQMFELNICKDYNSPYINMFFFTFISRNL